MKMPAVLLAAGLVLASGCGTSEERKNPTDKGKPDMEPAAGKTELATFGGGCFWCVEAIYQRVDGVRAVASGYSGGHVERPTYKQVCGGETGHAEVVQLTFDPARVSYRKLLEIFFSTHDPTTLNRQGADSGTQYRSVVFYHSEAQRAEAEKLKAELDQSGNFNSPLVTEITKAPVFYQAEAYHQDYFRQNPYQPYCLAVIRPKVEKFEKSKEEK